MLNDNQRYSFLAYHFTETLKLKDVDRIFSETAQTQSATKLLYKDGPDSYFFVYRFGSLVFFNVEAARQTQIMEKIKAFMGQKPDTLASEEFYVEISPDQKEDVGFNSATLNSLTLEKVDILALILARSTALEYFEFKVEDLMKQTGDLGDGLKNKGRLVKRASEIKRFIGHCITTKQDLVSTAYLLDKPDETWNDQALDYIYHDAADIFEIRERYKTVDYKLRMVQENLELISELLQYRNANSLEWAIIVLIAVEMAFFVFEAIYMRQ